MKRKFGFFYLTLFALTFAVVFPVYAQNGNLLSQYESNVEDFTRVEIDNYIVYYKQHMIGDAIVEGALTVYQFDKATNKLIDKKETRRADVSKSLPDTISQDEAEFMVEGKVLSSELLIISPDSQVYPLDPPPTNPCWVVRTITDGALVLNVIDAVTGEWLDDGVPPPYEGFAMSGPQYSGPCSGTWTSWYQNAESWFETMGYDTEAAAWPTAATVQSHIQSTETAVFYELAHGGSTSFANGCANGNTYDYITAANIETWISGYTKMPFTFIGSCGGMCSTGDNTFSYEFRKGSSIDTTTVGYCHMDAAYCATCWNYSIQWQDAFFSYVDAGRSVYAAYNQALADYPVCVPVEGACMRFAGDTTSNLNPGVERVPTSRGPCCNDSPPGVAGCIDAAVEAAVCAVDTYCCTTRWDSLCVGEVASVYGDNCDCCEVSSAAEGCYDFNAADHEAVSDCVCAADPYCCSSRWDSICVDEVESLSCGSC